MAAKGKRKGGQGGQMVVWGLLVLLMMGLAGFGATNFGGRVGEIGTVGDVKIGTDDYARALQQEIQRLSQQTGQNITAEQARAFGLDQMVLQQLVGRAALDEEARRIGLSVGDAEVARQIQQIPAFQGIDGRFDRDGYEFVLDRNGMTPARFEEQVRADAARGLLQGAVTSGVRVPDVFVDTLYAYARETRDASFATLGPTDLTAPIPEPTDAQLETYHREHPEAFTSPEGRVITYAWVTPDMLAGEIDSDEALLRQLYDQRADQYVQPERRLVERLVFADEATAQAAADRIARGEATFDQIVGERGLTLTDIDLGDVARDQLGAAGEAVFALAEPGVAGPAPTDLGPALFRVNAILAAHETTFEEVRDDLAAEVEADQARRQIEDMEGPIEDLLASGATLEELAGETAMELGTMTLDTASSEGPAAYQAFRDAAFAAQLDDYPDLHRLDDGGLFALRVDEVRPPALRPLAEVRTEVVADWRAAETRAALMQRAEAAAAAIAGGVSFADQGLSPGAATGVLRDGVAEGMPAGAVDTLFAMAPGEARAIETPLGAAVIRLDQVNPPDQLSAEATAAKLAFGEQSAAGLADDLIQAFVRSAQDAAGIRLDQGAIDAVHTQLP